VSPLHSTVIATNYCYRYVTTARTVTTNCCYVTTALSLPPAAVKSPLHNTVTTTNCCYVTTAQYCHYHQLLLCHHCTVLSLPPTAIMPPLHSTHYHQLLSVTTGQYCHYRQLLLCHHCNCHYSNCCYCHYRRLLLNNHCTALSLPATSVMSLLHSTVTTTNCCYVNTEQYCHYHQLLLRHHCTVLSLPPTALCHHTVLSLPATAVMSPLNSTGTTSNCCHVTTALHWHYHQQLLCHHCTVLSLPPTAVVSPL
jgi:hypothetical protein